MGGSWRRSELNEGELLKSRILPQSNAKNREDIMTRGVKALDLSNRKKRGPGRWSFFWNNPRTGGKEIRGLKRSN